MEEEKFTESQIVNAVMKTVDAHRQVAYECGMCGFDYECECGEKGDYPTHLAQEVLNTLTKS